MKFYFKSIRRKPEKTYYENNYLSSIKTNSHTSTRKLLRIIGVCEDVCSYHKTGDSGNKIKKEGIDAHRKTGCLQGLK
jgi:hypothetical protein